MTTIPQQEDTPTRPELLKILCILTFVGSGLSLFSNILMFLSIDIVKVHFENGDFNFLAESMNLEAIEILISISKSYFIFQAIVFSMSIYGAYMMWNLKKIGFHIYTISQITLIILSQIFIHGLPFPLFEIMISLVFITFYARTLKFMT